MKKPRTNQGFVVKIVLIIVALIFVKYYFHIDIVEWYKSPTGQKYVGSIWNMIKDFYNWADNYARTKVF